MFLLQEYPQLKIIQKIARQKKTPVFLVGGFLRDYTLGSLKKDFDFAVAKDALKLSRLFSKEIKGAYVVLDEGRGCARVVKKMKGVEFIFDFADFRAKTLRGDLNHRDFTINTLAVDLLALEESSQLAKALLDFKAGLKDLKKKRIKMVSRQGFKEDPLRVLRAFSLKAILGFEIEAQTLTRIKKDKDLITDVSYERIREELFKILESPRTPEVLKSMDKIGLLERIIPQIRVMFDCLQGGYHHLDVWPHSLETVVQLEKILEEFKEDSDAAEYLRETLGSVHSRKALLKLAALLHDIGKPDTKKEENGRTSFHSHERVGKNIVRSIARLLKLSKQERFALENIVLWHLRPGYLSNFEKPSERSIYRYFRDTKEEAASILLLSLADQRSTRGPLTTQEDQRHHEQICRALVRKYFEKKKEKPFVRLINGRDLIKHLRLKPSPLFGKILSAVEEKQMLGKITTKQEALKLAEEIGKG